MSASSQINRDNLAHIFFRLLPHLLESCISASGFAFRVVHTHVHAQTQIHFIFFPRKKKHTHRHPHTPRHTENNNSLVALDFYPRVSTLFKQHISIEFNFFSFVILSLLYYNILDYPFDFFFRNMRV